MYTSLLALVVTMQAATTGAEISWSPDYAHARKQSAAENKPIAVFLGNGEQGFNHLVRDAGLSKDAADLLSTYYVCVYIDTTAGKGKEMADAFRMSNGVVLSDRSGVYQQYRQESPVSDQDLMTRLKIYATAPAIVAAATTTTSTSNYYNAGAGYYGAGYNNYNMGNMGSYCPSCSGGGGGGRYRR